MRNDDSKLPPGPLPDALCRAVADAHWRRVAVVHEAENDLFAVREVGGNGCTVAVVYEDRSDCHEIACRIAEQWNADLRFSRQGSLPAALAPEIHAPEPDYLDADGPHEPERVVSMGVAEAEREALADRDRAHLAACFRRATLALLRSKKPSHYRAALECIREYSIDAFNRESEARRD